MINELMHSNVAQSVGWALVHFLWQGLAVGILAWLALALVPARNSNLRYAIGCAALVLMLACPIFTIAWLANAQNDYQSATTSVSQSIPGTESVSPVTFGEEIRVVDNSAVDAIQLPQDSVGGTDLTDSSSKAVGGEYWPASDFFAMSFSQLFRFLAPTLPVLTILWIAGVTFLSLKMILSWYHVQVLRKSGVPVKDTQTTRLLERLAKGMSINFAVQLRESIAVNSPAAIGWLRPVILLPLSSLTGLNQQQLTAILAHELAHIRRADYLVNLLQSVIETLLFYHPAVWWISRQIRAERENCCDDLAVQFCGDRRIYADALLVLEQTRSQSQPFVMASDGGDLVKRISRVLGKSRQRHSRSNWLAAVMAATVVALFVFGSMNERTAIASDSVVQKQEGVAKQDEKQTKTMKVQVIAPDKTPVADASLTLGIWYQETANTLRFTTDENGIAEVPIPEELRIFRLWAFAGGYAGLFANWEEDEVKAGGLPPAEFTFQMIPAVEIGGVFVDENDRPIEGVTVDIRPSGGDIAPGRIRFDSSETTTTDGSGNWSLNNIPPGDKVRVSLKITHPDFLSDEKWGDMQASQLVGFQALRDKSAKIILHKGVKVRGSVTDESGVPVTDALIIWGDNPYGQEGSQEIPVKIDGTYETATQKNGELRITVVAPGFAPGTIMVTVGKEMPETDFVLSPGKRLEIHFVDDAGKPVPGAYVGLNRWRKVEALYNYRHPNVINTRIPNRSDNDGVYVWDWAPRDAVTYTFSSRGYHSQFDVSLTASDEPITVVLKRPQKITGTVLDTDGQRVKSFAVIPQLHFRENSITERRESLVYGKDGEFEIELTTQDGKYSLKIEADGYETFETDRFERGDGAGPFTLTLKPATPTHYVVVNEEGQRVPDATIVVVPQDQVLSSQGFFDSFSMKRTQNAKTDSDGSFFLSRGKVPRTLMAISAEGYGEVADYPDQPTKEITTRKWASLKGQATLDGKPWRTQYFIRPIRYMHGHSFHIQMWMRGDSDGEGKFGMDRIASMPVSVGLFGRNDPQGLRCNLAISPKPGEQFNLDFSNCSHFNAKVRLAGENSGKANLANSRFTLTRLEPSVELPAELLELIKQNRLETLDVYDVIQWFNDREEYHQALLPYGDCFDSYSGPLPGTRNISADILRPGKYQLRISVHAETNGFRIVEPMSDFSQMVEIGEGPTELGEIEVPLFPEPQPDDAIADFDFAVLKDKSQTSLSKHRGKYVLLDFWCPWCDRCGEETPKVQMLAKLLAKKGKTNIVSLMANGTGPVKRVPEQSPDGIEWIDGQVSIPDERHIRRRLGVWTSQHFVLIDPDGKFVTGGSLAVVANKLEELGLK